MLTGWQCGRLAPARSSPSCGPSGVACLQRCRPPLPDTSNTVAERGQRRARAADISRRHRGQSTGITRSGRRVRPRHTTSFRSADVPLAAAMVGPRSVGGAELDSEGVLGGSWRLQAPAVRSSVWGASDEAIGLMPSADDDTAPSTAEVPDRCRPRERLSP